jgi:deazaflavin-dependent oxidoreductase (nitroreductase family)
MKGRMMANRADWNKQIIEEFRANQGKVGGRFSDMTLLLLHTTGARSGKPRLNPVAYTRDGERYVIIASKGGSPENPDWYYNLVANPRVKVEVEAEMFEALAEVAPETERTRLFEQMAARHPGFAEYQKRTERVIPVVTLIRIPE